MLLCLTVCYICVWCVGVQGRCSCLVIIIYGWWWFIIIIMVI
jgi:hypothetical protein